MTALYDNLTTLIIDMCGEKESGDVYELAKELAEKAIRYTKYRMDWFTMEREEKAGMDKYRTSSHNSFIDSLNIFLRFLSLEENAGKYDKWLGQTTPNMYLVLVGQTDRKEIGDFANYLAYRIAVSQR